MAQDSHVPAFPLNPHEGMSLREWYAGLAMHGVVGSGKFIESSGEGVAEKAFEMADAMMRHIAK